jgi:large subunit ribosomal protein L30
MVKQMASKIAIVRIRGIRSVKPRIKRTMELMRIEKPNHCVVIDDTVQNMGMVQVVKDYVTFGPIKVETLELLLKKRGEKGSLKFKTKKDEEIKKIAKEVMAGTPLKNFADPVFRLHPPKKGIKNIKLAYPLGVIGKRDNMDAFIRKMI